MWRWMISSCRRDAAKEDSDRNDRERILPGHKCDQDARKAIASVQRRIGLALYSRYFAGPRAPRKHRRSRYKQ